MGASPSSPSRRRIRKELHKLWVDPPPFCRPGASAVTDLLQWEVVIDGPEGSPYAGGTFPVDVKFTGAHPFKPPKITLKTKIDRSIVVPPEHRLGGAHGPGHLRQEMEPGPDDRQAPPLHRLRPLRPHARLPDQQPHLSPVQERHQAVREEGQGLDPEVLLDAGRFLLPREGRRAVARIPRRHRCSLRREGTGRETPRCCCILVDPPRGRVARQEQRETPVEKGNGVSSGPVRGGAIYGECRSKLAQEEISELRHLYCPEKKTKAPL